MTNTYTIYTKTENASTKAFANANKFVRAYIVTGTLEDVKAYINTNSLNVTKVYDKSGRKVAL